MTIIDAVERFRVPTFTLADRLAKARNEAGITQERMGQLLGCSRRTIVRYETSEKVPRAVVLAYHVATQTDLQWLETGYASSGLATAPTNAVGAGMVHPPGLEPGTHCFREGHLASVVDIGSARSLSVPFIGGGEAA